MRAVQRRGLEIFLLAFLFRLQSLVLSHGEAWTLLKVDILNVMGLTIMGAATLWGFARTPRARIAVFAVATAAIVWLSPSIRALVALGPLPDAIEGYLRPIPGLTNFTFFPWAAFLTAGTCLGVLLDGAREPGADRRLNLSFIAGGLLLAFAAWRASFVAPLDPRSSFWTTSASFFFMRLAVMVAAIGVAYVWEQRSTAGRRWSPLRVLGRSSLFIYWIHVELVYGLISLPLHGAFSLAGAWAALGVFCLLMLAAAVAKDWMAGKFNRGSSLRNQLSRVAQPLMF
jgi:fucose 4-O-acetylase-like acetyltransferase